MLTNAYAVIAAAGYLKSQSYVPWTLSRSAHFVDPALRSILDSALTPDDDDLFASNLHGKPILAIHGYDKVPCSVLTSHMRRE
jgi:hypothetical protein